MYYRIETEDGLLATVQILNLILDEELDPCDDFGLWGHTPEPPPGSYGKFWFTPKGWAVVGIKIMESIISEGWDFKLRSTNDLNVCYRDAYQVACKA